MEPFASRIVAGLSIALAGLGIVGLYTVVNGRSRRQGSRAHWLRGWLLAVPGMSAVGVGWLLLASAGPHIDAPAVTAVGWILGVAALALYFVGASRVGRLRLPSSYSLGLDRGGIYRWVRHPQALALCLAAAATGLITGSVPFLLSLPLWIAGWTAYTYLEERFELIPSFGDEYRAYRTETARLIPGLRLPWPRRDAPAAPKELSRPSRREARPRARASDGQRSAQARGPRIRRFTRRG